MRGMYRGLGPTIYGYLPTWAIYFTVYDSLKRRLGGSRFLSLSLIPRGWFHSVGFVRDGDCDGEGLFPFWVTDMNFLSGFFGLLGLRI